MTSSASSIRTIVSGGDSADRRNGELQFVSSTSGQGLGKISFNYDASSTNRGLKLKVDDKIVNINSNGNIQFVSETSGQGLGEISYTQILRDTNRELKFTAESELQNFEMD